MRNAPPANDTPIAGGVGGGLPPNQVAPINVSLPVADDVVAHSLRTRDQASPDPRATKRRVPHQRCRITELLTPGHFDATQAVQEISMVTRSNLTSGTTPRGAGGAAIIGAESRDGDGPGPYVMDAK